MPKPLNTRFSPNPPMEIFHKPVFLLLFTFILLNLTPFSYSRGTILWDHVPKSVDQTMIHLRSPAKPDEHQQSYGSSASMGKNDQKQTGFLDGLPQDSYGDPYDYGNPYPDGIFGFPRGLFGFPRGFFGFPRGFFGFPRGLFGFPRGIFGFPGDNGGNPGVYGVNPGGYGGNPGGYGGNPGGYGGNPGGYGGGRPRDKPGGGGGYEGKTRAMATGKTSQFP